MLTAMEQGKLTPNTGTTTSQNQASPTMSVENMIEHSIGRVNFTQIVQALLASIPLFFDGQQTLISVFAQVEPPWHCTSSTSCVSNSDICRLSKGEWAWDAGKKHTSIISDWNLECANSFITGMPTSCHFVGCLLGGLAVAMFGDSSLGRRELLIFSSLLMSSAAFASAFAPNIWVYSGFRFLSGIGRAPLMVCALVLLAEKVGKRWRRQVTSIGFILISLGTIALTGIAYATRDSSWRILYLCTSIPGIVCPTLSYFFLYESPRWLLMQTREKDALIVLRRLGSSTQVFEKSPNICFQETLQNTNPFLSLNILFNRMWATKQLLASMGLGFGIGLMYFGMLLGFGNVGFNIYLTSIFNSLTTLSSYMLTFLFWIQHYNRRSSLIGFCTVSGITSIVFSNIGRGNKSVVIGLELVIFFCTCMAHNVMLMYVMELFPTCVRSTSSSLVRQAMILGSVFDPLLILIGKSNFLYSYGVFGVTILLCSFLVIYLPETRGKVLCDTIEEQECRDLPNDSTI